MTEKQSVHSLQKEKAAVYRDLEKGNDWILGDFTINAEYEF
jgi:hypothetical protein